MKIIVCPLKMAAIFKNLNSRNKPLLKREFLRSVCNMLTRSLSQLIFTCSTIETIEKDVKYVQS